ncbi:hypothetical protein [Pseudomonas sp. LRF_L74]|uniref:hypothetical protein n=1 Tax=Pseudomonas sp. LRF_L74 TaxID=3369422 RepID=UPI003F604693
MSTKPEITEREAFETWWKDDSDDRRIVMRSYTAEHWAWEIWQARSAQPASVAVPDDLGRTPQDYAIEHAEYMAVAAESAISKYQEYSKACIDFEERDDGDASEEAFEVVNNAESDLTDGLINLQSMIYEFRKRRDRAAAAPGPGQHESVAIAEAKAWCAENESTPAEFLSYQLLVKRSDVLGRPLTWREAIELTALTTNMPDDERDRLLALDDESVQQTEQTDGSSLVVWRAIASTGDVCHFGEASCARAWAGKKGSIERVELTPVPDLQLVPPVSPDIGLVSVTREDANNYCLILTVLQMEEEGDPVAEVKRLVGQSQNDTSALVEALDRIAQMAEGQLELISKRAPGKYLDKAPIVRVLRRYQQLAAEAMTAHKAGGK